VLTTAERQHPPAIVKAAPSLVTRASYEQSINQPRSPKPLDQWSEQDAAANALGRIGAAGRPRARRSPSVVRMPDMRLKATEVLGRMGTDAKAAVSDLTRLLDDTDERVRRAATRTIGQIGPDAQQAVPALVAALFESPSPSQP